MSGYAQFVRILLNRGANVAKVNDHGFTSLPLAVPFGHLEVTIVGCCRRRPRSKMLRRIRTITHGCQARLLEGYALADEGRRRPRRKKLTGFSPLLGASGAGRFEAVELLVEVGADTEARTYHGDTVLHLAAVQGARRVCNCWWRPA